MCGRALAPRICNDLQNLAKSRPTKTRRPADPPTHSTPLYSRSRFNVSHSEVVPDLVRSPLPRRRILLLVNGFS